MRHNDDSPLTPRTETTTRSSSAKTPADSSGWQLFAIAIARRHCLDAPIDYLPTMKNYPLSASTPVWAGRVLSAIVLIVLLADAFIDLVAPSKIATEMAATGFSAALATPLGIIILVCALAYAIPVTSFFGAILVSAFAGGAICAHFRLGEIGSPPQIFAVLIGVFAWAGLLLRRFSWRSWQTFVGGDRSEG